MSNNPIDTAERERLINALYKEGILGHDAELAADFILARDKQQALALLERIEKAGPANKELVDDPTANAIRMIQNELNEAWRAVLAADMEKLK